MTTAARPTFHPAVGGEDQGYFRMEAGTRQISVKDMPGHTRLKMRKMEAAKSREELQAQLEDRERAAKSGKKDEDSSSSAPSLSLGGGAAPLQLGSAEAEKDADDIDAANVEVRAPRRAHPTPGARGGGAGVQRRRRHRLGPRGGGSPPGDAAPGARAAATNTCLRARACASRGTTPPMTRTRRRS